jgi:hypothetical protein
VRRFELTGFESQITTLKPGAYVMAMYFSAANTASMNYSIRGGDLPANAAGVVSAGADKNFTATSQLSSIPAFGYMLGMYTTTTGSPPASVNYTQVSAWTFPDGYPWFRLYSR